MEEMGLIFSSGKDKVLVNAVAMVSVPQLLSLLRGVR